MSRASFVVLSLSLAFGCSGASDSSAGAPPSDDAAGNGADGCCPELVDVGAGGEGGTASLDLDDGEDASAGAAAGPGCSDALWREAQATSTAAQALVYAATELTQRVRVACASLHEELSPDYRGSAEGGGTVAETCGSAANVLATHRGDSEPLAALEGGRCRVITARQTACEQACSNGCSPSSTLERCGEQNVVAPCSGLCSEGSVCEGTAAEPTECTGDCSGTCHGSCEGTCVATSNQAGTSEPCDGFCSGLCTGLCTGDCRIRAEGAGQKCGDGISCQGACSTSSTADGCLQPLGLPQAMDCQLSDTCYQACAAVAALSAECTSPTVTLVGGFSANVVTALEAYLAPLVHTANGDGRLAAAAGDGLVQAMDRIDATLRTEPACLAHLGIENLVTAADVLDAHAAIEEAVQAASGVVQTAFGKEQWESMR